MPRKLPSLIGNKHAVGNEPNRTSFQSGHTPWNKGVHRATSPKCLRTAFKKGQKPANILKIGTITVRIDVNGCQRRWIKISNKQPRWKIYSQWLWEKKRGKIPTGLIVHHKDGNSMNDRISNYKLVTKSQHIECHRKDFKFGKQKYKSTLF